MESQENRVMEITEGLSEFHLIKGNPNADSIISDHLNKCQPKQAIKRADEMDTESSSSSLSATGETILLR
jgi:hypothetical protein